MYSIWNAAFGTLHGRSGALINYEVREPNHYIHFTLKILFTASYFIGRRNVRHWFQPVNTSKGLPAPANNSDNRWSSLDGVCEMKSLVWYFVSVTFCMPVCLPPPLLSGGQIPHKANSLVRGIELKLWVLGTYRRLSCLSALELYRAGGSWIYRGQTLNRGEFFTNNVMMRDVRDIESAYVNVKFVYL